MTIEDKGRNIIEARASGVANTTRNLIYSSLNHRNRRPPHFQPPRMRLHEPISKWLIGNVICVTLVMPRWLETNLHVKAINESLRPSLNPLSQIRWTISDATLSAARMRSETCTQLCNWMSAIDIACWYIRWDVFSSPTRAFRDAHAMPSKALASLLSRRLGDGYCLKLRLKQAYQRWKINYLQVGYQ